MRTRTSVWFEIKIRYDKVQEDGLVKKVTEQYVVDALSFTEAETSITENMKLFISGDFKVSAIAYAAYGEIFFSDKDLADKWYKAKLQFITIDEKTEKEKKSTVTYLVQAASLDEAKVNINEVMGSTMFDYTIHSIVETQIMDVFEHKTSNE